MKTVIGLFDDFQTAQNAVQSLVNRNFNRNDISVAANNTAAGYSADALETASEGEGRNVAMADGAKTGAGTGAVIGTGVGGVLGLLASLGTIWIPGIGPIVAAGPLVATLTGAGIGAVTGGVIGALTHVGVPEDHAQHYAEGVRRGGTLVTVHADEAMTSQVMGVMNRHHAVDVSERAAQWRAEGWKGYDASAKAYTAAEAARKREICRSLP